jgi:adenylate cyclase
MVDTIFNDAGNVLGALMRSHASDMLTERVQQLSVSEFVCLLDFITAEFQQYRRALGLIEHETLETILEQLVDAFTLKIGQILNVEKMSVFLIDADRQQLWVRRTQQDGEVREVRIPHNVGIVGFVAQNGQIEVVNDIPDHDRFDPEVDLPQDIDRDRVLNLLYVPVFGRLEPHTPIAVIQLVNHLDGQPFTESDVGQMRGFAVSLGVLLDGCQSFYSATQNQRGVSALLNATSSLGQSLDLETTLRGVMSQAQRLMKADRSTLFLLSKDGHELWTKVAKADGKTMMEIRIPADRGIAGYVASTGKPLNIPDAYQDPRFDPSTDQRTGYHTRNILCMPVLDSENKLIGVTQLINKFQGSFTRSDEFFLEAFNIQAGIALENAKLFENVNLEKQYQKDILQSLSDAVISTDMKGQIVTINEAALVLLGCPQDRDEEQYHHRLWTERLIGIPIWEAIPIENFRFRLEDSLANAARHYVPEQTVSLGLYRIDSDPDAPDPDFATTVLVTADRHNPDYYHPWAKSAPAIPSQTHCTPIPHIQVQKISRSLNLTVTPLTNPEGGVRGGLIILEDISREKRMKAAMYRYMTPKVAEQVMALGDDSLMVGERKDVTVLFSDIRGYTTLTENLGASEVVTLLNQYFETMVEAVFTHEGTLDKFIGDALMAVFGAPLPLTEKHTLMAVRSALDMRRRLVEFNQHRVIDNQPLIRFGIGISSGEVVSGNIGSQRRMDYTAIGDAVNLSARLESLTKEYGCDIIISESTYRNCSDSFWVRELDKIRVKGKSEAVSIYELIDDRRVPLDPVATKFLYLYKMGREDFLDRNFEQALVGLEAAAQIRPDDRAVAYHIEQAHCYLENPPPEDWDGVRTMTHK